MDRLSQYDRIFVVDTEYHSAPGEPVRPICICAMEVRSMTPICSWLWQQPATVLPVQCGDRDLFVCFSAMAEFSVYTALGWALPINVLDLWVEHRAETNGVVPPGFCGLVEALRYHEIIDDLECDRRKKFKDEMRQICIDGVSEAIEASQGQIMAYCQGDVADTAALLRAMAPCVDVDRARYRGTYLRSLASIEGSGVPMDMGRLVVLRDRWDAVRQHLAALANLRYPGVYHQGTCAFDSDRFRDYLHRIGIHDWPRQLTGNLKLDSDTWDDQVEIHPQLGRLHQIRSTISRMRTVTLAVGADGRNRCGLRPFSSRSGRNQPSNSKHIFGCSKWLRGLIRAPVGRALSYLDYSQQEFGIAAKLSGDSAMQAAYLSGDPYLAFAKQIGLIPIDGTKRTHPEQREIGKRCVMGVQFVMGARSLGQRVGREEEYGRILLAQHRRAYPDYWCWSDQVVAAAHFGRSIRSRFGWPIHVFLGTKDRTLANFPMQSNGAEILRLAVILAVQGGVQVVAPVHDAILIEADVAAIDEAIATAKSAMIEASKIVLDGFALRVDNSGPILGRFPELGDGQQIWDQVWAYLGVDP